MFYVYSHIQQDTGKIFYIGKGKGARAYSDDRSKLWKNVANKHGWKAVIICDDLTEEEAFEVEKFYIKHYGRRDLGTGNLVNFTDGGDGPSNPSIETRNKISEANLGKKHSEETRNKISEANLGKKHSEETRKKISHTNKGKPSSMIGRSASDTTRKKISESHKGKSLSDDHRKQISNSSKGRIFSEEHRKKMSEAAKRRHQNNKLEL